MSVGTVLGSLSSAEGDYIKSQFEAATWYDGIGWFGALATIEPQKMYKIKQTNPDELLLQGDEADPCTPIVLNTGWNWVGYPLHSALTVADALESINPVENDIIKSQFETATFYEGYGWFGELTQLEPGEGFMIKVGHVEEVFFPGCEGWQCGDLLNDERDGHEYNTVKIGGKC